MPWNVDFCKAQSCCRIHGLLVAMTLMISGGWQVKFSVCNRAFLVSLAGALAPDPYI